MKKNRNPNLLQGFLHDESGASIIMIGVMILTLIVAVGVAVDMGRAQLIKNKMSASLDAAALAAASHADTEDMNVTAAKYFRANFPVGYMGSQMDSIEISPNAGNRQVTFAVRGSIPTAFLGIVGINRVNLASIAEVTRVTKNGLELAMVLDNTGSMDPALNGGRDKIGQLKDATKAMIDILYENGETLEDVYISLVPFNTRVSVGRQHENWLFEPMQTEWQGCVGEPRSGDQQMTDLPPTGGIGSKFEQYIYNNDPLTQDPCLQPISAMLTTKTAIKAAINALTTGGATHTDVGTVWGWRILSPRWRGLWGVNAEYPLDYADGTSRKAMILLTDGDNTAPDAESPQQAAAEIARHNNKQAELCATLKQQGVRIYAVAFDITSGADPNSIKNILRGCASKPEYYFDAPDGPQLINAFKQIGDNLLSLRLSR